MSFFDALSISASALAAERQRTEIIAANLANARTTHTQAGGPFRRREVVFESTGTSSFRLALARSSELRGPAPGSVQITQVVDDPSPAILRYEPGHPDANKEGYVAYPAINPAAEMVDLMDSVRAYQLNASAVAATKQMMQETIQILKS
jgi:flagellar basal-body rod protein FlgC